MCMCMYIYRERERLRTCRVCLPRAGPARGARGGGL